MRHHGRAEDADGEQHRLLALEAGNEQVRHDLAGIGTGEQDLEGEGDHDDAHEPGDDRFDPPKA